MPRRVHAPALSLEASPFFRLLLLVNLTARPFERLYRGRFQVSLVEWRVLLAIANGRDVSAGEVGEALGLDKMAVSRAVRGLERHGRVARRVDPTDGRRAVLALTEAGRELYRAIAPSARDRENALLADLGPEERALLDRLLDRLVDTARRLPDGG